MSIENNKSKDLLLRQKAERLLKKKSIKKIDQLSESEALRLIHELEVHQIELELQNEELVEAKSHMHEIAEKYTELYDFAPSGYFTLSKEGEIIEVNLYGAKILGKDLDQLKNSRFGFFVSDSTKTSFNLFLEKVFNNKDIATCEVVLSNDNRLTYINLSGRVTKNREQCFVTAVDITERKLAEEALQISFAKYQVLFNSFPIGISLSDKHGNIVESNEKAEELLGLTVDEQLNRNIGGSEWSNIIQTDGSPFPPEEFPSVIALKENRIVENIEMGIVKGENEKTWINVTAAPVSVENYGVTIAYNDITERLTAEEALRKSEEQFHSLFDNMGEGVALHDLVLEDGKPVNYRILEVNNAFLKIIGISREKVVGNLCTEVYGITSPPFFEIYTEVVRSKKSNYFETYFAPMEKHFGISVAPWSEHGFATIFSDISKRIRTEEEINLKNDELLKINAEKDKFFSIIAHDLRGPFGTFLGFTEMMVSDLNQMETLQILKLAEMMQKSASNLYVLLNNLLEWSQIQQGSIPFIPTVIQLRSMVAQSVAMISDAVNNKRIEVTFFIPENMQVFTDIHFLQTVIRNLVSNAIKFTPEGGKVSLSAKVHDAKNVELSVCDTGIGMSKAIVDNLFRVDVKTNRLGTNNEPSSGLGLLLCKEFIENYGGQLWVESEEGKGSTFCFTIPHHVPEKETNAKKLKTLKEENENDKKKLKILIAEDDEASELLISTLVKKIGEIVISAKNGAEAVEACLDNPDLDLILMDLHMPEMDGIEATRQIRLFNSNLVIIAQTAFAVTESREKAMKAGCTDYLLKPIKKSELTTIIQKYFSTSY